MSIKEDVMIHYQLWPQQHQHIYLVKCWWRTCSTTLFIYFLFFVRIILMNISIESHIHMSTCQCLLHTTIMRQCLSRLLRTNTGVESIEYIIAISHIPSMFMFWRVPLTQCLNAIYDYVYWNIGCVKKIEIFTKC